MPGVSAEKAPWKPTVLPWSASRSTFAITSVPTGPMTVQVGSTKVTIATGPVIAGTAIRDAVGFISIGDFTNQIDYAEAANQINAKVKTDVIAKVDLKSVQGKKVEFYGAFSSLSPGTIFLVPTELAVK